MNTWHDNGDGTWALTITSKHDERSRTVTVDAEVAEKAKRHSWFIQKVSDMPATTMARKQVTLHRWITGAPGRKHVRFTNGDRNDMRRANLYSPITPPEPTRGRHIGNEWTLREDGVVEVKLSTTDEIALVDAEDWERLKHRTWRRGVGGDKRFVIATNTRARGKKDVYLMHREVVQEPGRRVRHFNGDTLDNRRSNLELGSRNNQLSRAARGFVYFMEAPEVGRVKIGFTMQDPRVRRVKLQCGSPVELVFLAVFGASMDVECALHAEFKASQTVNEWFTCTHEIRALAKALDGQLCISVAQVRRERDRAKASTLSHGRDGRAEGVEGRTEEGRPRGQGASVV